MACCIEAILSDCAFNLRRLSLRNRERSRSSSRNRAERLVAPSRVEDEELVKLERKDAKLRLSPSVILFRISSREVI